MIYAFVLLELGEQDFLMLYGNQYQTLRIANQLLKQGYKLVVKVTTWFQDVLNSHVEFYEWLLKDKRLSERCF